MSQSSLVGSILERKPVSKPSSPSQAATRNGFPAVQHRSQSAFARARGGAQKRVREVPTVQSSPVPRNQESSESLAVDTAEGWRAQVEEDNRRRVEAMTEEEREQIVAE